MFIECEKACIYSQDGVFIAEVKVVDSDKDSPGLILEEEDLDKVNTESVVVFYDGVQGLVTCRCSLAGRVKINGDETGGSSSGAIFKVPCQIDELMDVDQRRRDLKVKVSIPVILEISDAGGDTTHIAARIKDISAGGVGFESAHKLNVEQIFSFLFDTDAGSVMLSGSVLWEKQLSKEGEPPRYRYGSCFFDMTSMEESMVRKFTFQEQLKRRKVR
ncbi:PilZ domain-containing protein [Lachnospiraceae bacterium 54-53]